ncbi:MAG TPA: alpha/beta hydrolase [Thermoguttaceae bacterium]|nr:alpha/beta hydrolase [Thermoguttaceae bacterium]
MRASLARALLVSCVLTMAAGCTSSGHRRWSPLGALENSAVFQPAPYSEGNWQPEGLDFEDVWFTAADGTQLHGWYCPHPSPRAAVLFAHGNAGNLSHRAELLRLLHDHLGVAVMAFDYRGYGRSTGSPDEWGILQDARAARAWLASRLQIAESDVVLMGRSLGGGVMVDLAAADGARGLILESTFTSLPEAAAEMAPWLPARLLMQNRLDSLSKIAHYHGPLLQSHGDADRVIPFEQGRRLFAAAPDRPGCRPKRFITIPGGDHNDPQTPDYYQALDEFLANLPPPTRWSAPVAENVDRRR